ncbi:MAG: sn-glycerol-1-phosphate dehydrogenase [Angelakisella sp.]
MIKPEELTISDYLGRILECECGRLHSTPLEYVDITAGAIGGIPKLLKSWGKGNAFIVSDCNTYAAAGRQVASVLAEQGIGTVEHVFPQTELVPDEKSVGALMTAFDPRCDVMIAVGTGTINDLCKFSSYKLRTDYLVVATAPSMDGFASGGAALITENLKTTYDTHIARAIIGDLDVLMAAPMPMLNAGFADILGKCSCLCDWKLSAIINGEYYCQAIVDMVQLSIRRVTASADGLKVRDPQAVQALMEALVLTGIAMSFSGNSRPASGSEHHLSHFWEMRFLLDGRHPVLHGTKVGIGTVASLKAYSLLKELTPDFDKATRHAEQFDVDGWEQQMRRVFGKAADGVIELEQSTMKNSPVTHRARLQKIRQCYPQLLDFMTTEVPDYRMAEEYLQELGAPVNPRQVGVERQMIVDAFTAAKEVRDRYTLLQFLWDLGELDEMAQAVADYFVTQTTTKGGVSIDKHTVGA